MFWFYCFSCIPPLYPRGNPLPLARRHYCANKFLSRKASKRCCIAWKPLLVPSLLAGGTAAPRLPNLFPGSYLYNLHITPSFASPGPWNISASPAGGDMLQLHHQTLLFYWILNMQLQSNSNEFAQGLRSVKPPIPSAAGFLNLKHLKTGDRIGAFNVRTDAMKSLLSKLGYAPFWQGRSWMAFSPILTIALVIVGSSILMFLNNVCFSKLKKNHLFDCWVSPVLNHLQEWR